MLLKLLTSIIKLKKKPMVKIQHLELLDKFRFKMNLHMVTKIENLLWLKMNQKKLLKVVTKKLKKLQLVTLKTLIKKKLSLWRMLLILSILKGNKRLPVMLMLLLPKTSTLTKLKTRKTLLELLEKSKEMEA